MIENVEGLGAELERVGLLDGEILVQRHVEIQAAGNIQGIASGVAEGQTLRRVVRCGVEEQRAGALAERGHRRLPAARQCGLPTTSG